MQPTAEQQAKLDQIHSVRFCVERCSQTGEIGLAMEHLPASLLAGDGGYMLPQGGNAGRIVAHDLLEHSHHGANIGTVADEARAVGGTWWTRWEQYGSTGNGTRTPYQELADEFASLVDEITERGGEYVSAPPAIDTADAEAVELAEIAAEAVRANGGLLDERGRDTALAQTDRAALRAFAADFPALFVEGYLDAAARSEANGINNQLFIYDVFTAIENAITDAGGATGGDFLEGTRWRLDYTYRGTAEMVEICAHCNADLYSCGCLDDESVAA